MFSIQNQVPQIIIGLGCVMYQIKALSVMIGFTLKIRFTLNIRLTYPNVEKNRFEIFDFSSNFDRVSRITLAYLCLILALENNIFFSNEVSFGVSSFFLGNKNFKNLGKIKL